MPGSKFLRERNGTIDTGETVRCTAGKCCPNCGSNKYRQTISLEECTACGLRCDYWGDGPNAAYEAMLVSNASIETDRQLVEQIRFKNDTRN